MAVNERAAEPVVGDKVGPGRRHAAALGLLGDVLVRCGYAEFVGHFNILSPSPVNWQLYGEAATADLRPLIDLFLLTREVEADSLPPRLRALLPCLLELELVVEGQAGGVSLGGLVVLFVLGNWLICDPPQADADYYLGEDSMALLTRMTPLAGGEALDLCAGPGLHALQSARFSRQVVAVELNPAAARLARINADFNRLGKRLHVLQGDLYGPVAGRRFDNVTANPPWLPYPPDLRLPSIGHGGRDGLSVLWRILEGLGSALRESGVAQIVGMTWSDGRSLLACERLADFSRISGLDLRVAALSHIGLDGSGPYVGRWLHTICAISGEKVVTCHDALMSLIAEAGATHLCPFFLSARPGRGRFELIDLSGGARPSVWHL